MRHVALLAVLCCAGLARAQVPAAAPRENLTTFDPRQTELQWKDNRWQLRAGGLLIKDFGRRQADGREALRLIRELGLTQLGTVGTPLPVMEYWLAGGRAPQGQPTGTRLSPLDLAHLRVEPQQEQWCVRDGPRVLFNFGAHREEAEQALAVIRKYGFTHVGQLGQSSPGLYLFVSNPNGTTTTPVSAPAPFVSRTLQPGERGPARPPSTDPLRPGAALTDARSAPGITLDEPAAQLRGGLAPGALPQGRQFGAAGLRPDLVSLAEQVPFDWRQAQVRRDGKDWKLAFGSYVLASFGSNERDARLAQSALQHYRFNQHCLVGRPSPTFSYFLVNGRAPQGLMFGVNSVPFRHEALVVRRDGERWVIGDSARMLLDFGGRQEEAQQTLQAIQRHRFDHLCRIGQDGGMTFFVRAR